MRRQTIQNSGVFLIYCCISVLKLIITEDHFSGPNGAASQLCVVFASVCVSVQTITVEPNDLLIRYLAC